MVVESRHHREAWRVGNDKGSDAIRRKLTVELFGEVLSVIMIFSSKLCYHDDARCCDHHCF